MYDFLIVGSGLAGSTIADLLKRKGYKIAVIEKKKYVGGS
ncbi:MAG: NAD(P)-binding protein, partial [Bacilli bacterium]|nr:NAD(P)-binding protein [Bacilli bacterium]MCI7220965.1 NAD(P)-binding protein [Bacilli bacterium]